MTTRMCVSRLIAPSISVLILIGCGSARTDNGPPAGGGSGGSAAGSDLGLIAVEGISTWKGNATAAYSIIHDDACDYILDSLFDVAEPALTARGLHAGFGAIVERCAERNVWDRLEVMVAHGHEILCHSWDHKDFVANDPTTNAPPDLSLEIDRATMVLAENLPDQKLQYFIFPFDSFSQSMIAHLGSVGYVGARAGIKGVNPPDFPDPLRGNFDVYNDENSIYYPQFSDVNKAYVDDAIAKGGWAIRELHGIQDTSWEPVPTADYMAHLDYVKGKVDSGELWVDTPSAVSHYRFARQYCGVPSALGSTLSFAAPSAQCSANATPLSVIVTTTVDAPNVSATQAGKSLTSKRLGGKRYLVDIDPTLGDVVLQAG
jgi:peptidoglycan/xylan/chitin deacetylase (PgdA/CDA1 family)